MKVVGRQYETVEATISGYQRRKVKDEIYPGLIPGGPKDIVKGLIYKDVSWTHLERLDRFEGEEYERISIECELTGGQRMSAFVYVFKEQYAHLLEDVPWEPGDFLPNGINQFIDGYKGFNELDQD